MPSQLVLQKKMSEVEEVAKLISEHRAVGVASLWKVRAAQLQGFKKKLADRVSMRVIKTALMKRAIQSLRDKPGLEKLAESLKGSYIYLFTDLNPFKLALLLEKGKIRTTAKSGDFAAIDVLVPAGNTGQPPGPVISQLNAVGLPTRIESGSVWVTKDTMVARKGDAISERLAPILTKLGIRPVEAGLSLKIAYDDGMLLAEEQLVINLNAVKKDLEVAHADAFALSLAVAFPTVDNVQPLLQVAHKEAYALAMNAALPTRETVQDLVRKAYAQALGLKSLLDSKKS